MTPVYGLEKGDKVEMSTKKNGCLGLPGLGGGFKYFLSIFIPIWGRFPFGQTYFSDGLVQPPTGNAGFTLLIHR